MINILLNEKDYAEKIICSNKLDKKPSFDLRVLAKYYYFEKELTPNKIYLELVKSMEEKYDNFSLAKWQDMLLNLAKQAKKYPMISIKYIPITENELITVDNIKNKRMKRFAFTLLCLAKYKNMVNSKNNDWVNYKFKEIFRMANINATKKEQGCMVYDMKNLGLVKMNKMVDNLSINVCYVDKDNSKEVLQITDFRNLGYEYLLYCGEDFIRCKECRTLVRQNKQGNIIYCIECNKYQPQETKIITCIDCGKQVEVDSKDNETCRCEECKKTYIKERDRIRKQKYRSNLSHAQIES